MRPSSASSSAKQRWISTPPRRSHRSETKQAKCDGQLVFSISSRGIVKGTLVWVLFCRVVPFLWRGRAVFWRIGGRGCDGTGFGFAMVDGRHEVGICAIAPSAVGTEWLVSYRNFQVCIMY